MFMTALNVEQSWTANLARIGETRFYDLEIRLHSAEPGIADHLARLPGVRRVEAWGYSPSAIARPGRIDVVRTYPDRGHGSLAILAPPPDTALVRFPLLAGRWLLPGDRDAVVLNHSAAAMAKVGTGDPILLSIDGRPHRWTVVGIVEEIGSPGAAYVAGTGEGSRMLRISTGARSPEERTAVIRAIERELAESDTSVEALIPLSELRTAIGDHIVILIRTLIAMAIVMAAVGALGLGSTMGISVLERTREIGVMKAIGATPARVTAMILTEALFIGALSYLAALLFSLPLTAAVDTLIGNVGFLAPLPFVLAFEAMLIWLVLLATVSIAATLLPARRASRLTVREAIAHL